jgi:hypothetical protein
VKDKLEANSGLAPSKVENREMCLRSHMEEMEVDKSSLQPIGNHSGSEQNAESAHDPSIPKNLKNSEQRRFTF